jgi:hypothetical protein
MAQALRTRIAARAPGRAHPREVREAVLAYEQARRGDGIAPTRIAHELGLSPATLLRWRLAVGPALSQPLRFEDLRPSALRVLYQATTRARSGAGKIGFPVDARIRSNSR